MKEANLHLTIRPIFDQLWVVVALAAALLVVWWWVTPGGPVTKNRRRALRGVRLVVILLALLAMLRPTLVRSTTREQRAGLLILLDFSRSMTLPGKEPSRSRWAAQREFVQSIRPLLEKLDESVDTKIWLYDTRPRAIDASESEWELPSAAGEEKTDVGGSLQSVLQDEVGQRLLGVIVMGDGNQTVFGNEVDPYAAARELGAAGVPLLTVPWGPTGSSAQSRDVAVEQFPERMHAFVKNELEVRGTVRVRGMADQQIPVELWLTDEKDQRRKVAEIQLESRDNDTVLPVRIPFVPEEPGQFRLTLSVPNQVGELLLDNNELTAFLSVREGGMRVLFIEGELRQEQKFIRWSLDASPDIEVDFQWFPNKQKARWPLSLGTALDSDRYDVFIIGDLPAAAIETEDWERLAERVNEGKGLIMLGGYRSFGVGGYSRTALANVLPVRMHRFTLERLDPQSLRRWHISGDTPMIPVRDHPVTRLGDRQLNTRIWERLPPLKGANRFLGVKVAPGIQVLLETPGEVPLLVAGEYGDGRTLAFAGDTTWQWWRIGKQALHKRFWRQVVLWLAKRDEDERKEVWAELSRRRFLPGAEVTIEGGVRQSNGDAVPGASLSAEFVRDPGIGAAPRRFALAATDSKELFRATLPKLMAPGTYRLKIAATADGQSLGSTELEFQVLDRDLELASHVADVEFLSRLAGFTQDAGGHLVTAEELRTVLEDWAENPPATEEPVLERWTLGESAPDAWIYLVLFVGLLSVEWIMRRRWGLA